jgi:toxin ParE1/3/4
VSTLRVVPEAEDELAAAILWYEARRRGLGIELMAVVDEALERIANAPLSMPLWRAPWRRCTLSRFPYVIFFSVAGDTVEVAAIAHGKRRPGYWIGRR